MRIVILTQYFPPETGAPQNRLMSLARALQRFGADVSVLTAMPNYPAMTIHPGYRGRWTKHERIDGIPVDRAWLFVSRGKSVPARLLTYFSFVFSSFWLGLFRMRRSDFLLCESPPLFLGITAFLLSRIKRAKLVFNVSDLWPESAEKLGLVTNRMFLGMATRLEEFLYAKAWLVTGQTNGIVRSVSDRVAGASVYWLPNGADLDAYAVPAEHAGWRQAQGYGADHVLFLYAGILGHAQGLGVILEAAERVRDDPKVRFALVGDGPEKRELMNLRERKGLGNVRFFDSVPRAVLPAVLSAADAGIVPLRHLPLFEGAVPSKLFDFLAMKKPILLGVDGEARQLFIDDAGAGLAYRPEDAAALADGVRRLAAAPDLRREMGVRGYEYVVAHFDREAIARGFHERLDQP